MINTNGYNNSKKLMIATQIEKLMYKYFFFLNLGDTITF